MLPRKLALAFVTLGLALLGWASFPPPAVAADFGAIPYSISTPEPEGRSSCELFVSVTKRAGIRAVLTVGLFAFRGEAQIQELGIGAGYQRGCDVFPTTHFTRFLLDESASALFFVWTLEVHTQGSDCGTGGQAAGVISVTGQAVENIVAEPLVCQ